MVDPILSGRPRGRRYNSIFNRLWDIPRQLPTEFNLQLGISQTPGIYRILKKPTDLLAGQHPQLDIGPNGSRQVGGNCCETEPV